VFLLDANVNEVKNVAYSNSEGGFRRNRYGDKAPVELGKIYESDIIEMSRNGDAGVAKIQGFVIFVSDTKTGDHVKFKITKVGGRYATAEVVKEVAESD